jgi:hypothetical protein
VVHMIRPMKIGVWPAKPANEAVLYNCLLHGRPFTDALCGDVCPFHTIAPASDAMR